MWKIIVDSNGIITNYTITDDEKITIGRSTDCNIILNDTKVSRYHAIFFLKKEYLYLKDKGSTNGTFVNNKKVFEKKISDGDIITIGNAYIKCFKKLDSIENKNDSYNTSASQITSEKLNISKYVQSLNSSLMELTNSSQNKEKLINSMKSDINNINFSYSKLLKEHHIIKSLYKINEVINQILDVTDIMVNMMDVAMNFTGARRGILFINRSSKSDQPVFEKNIYIDMIKGFVFTKNSKELQNIKFDEKIIKYCLENNNQIVSNNLLHDKRYNYLNKYSFFSNTKAIMAVPIISKKKKNGVMLFDIDKSTNKIFTESDSIFMDAFSSQCAISLENAFLYSEIRRIYFSTIQVLSSALDAKDSYTEGHSQRVTEYSVAVAEELNLSKQDIEDIQIAAILHDIGKIGIRDFILCKPGKLTKDEYEIIKNHPSLGAEIVSHIEFLSDKADIIKYHHERFDGKGYPEGLSGTNIPFFSRIIAVCDSFDAMTSKRAYKNNLPVENALNELIDCSNTQFDPEIVNIFIKVFKRDFFNDFERRVSLFKAQDVIHE